MPIKQRGNGLEVSVQVTRNGAKVRHREIVHCTMDDALAHEAQVRADLMAGRPPAKYKTTAASRGITLADALEVVFERYWAHGANARHNRANIEQCKEFFGASTQIDKITTVDADDFIAHLQKKDLAPSTIRQKCCVMTKMFNHFVRRGNLTARPHFEMPKIGDNTRDRVISEIEEKRLLALFACDFDTAVPRKGNAGSDFYDLFVFLMDVGCRPSEARHINMRNVTNRRLTLKVTKTDLSRTLPLTERAEAALRRQELRRGEMPFAWATNNVIRYAWDWARANMGLDGDDGFIPYALRHTCATRLYDKTRDIMIVQKWLGHKTITMTLRYAKLQPHDLDNARDMMEAA